MSFSAKSKPIVTEETKLKQSLVRTGKPRSEETREKMKATWAAKKAEGYRQVPVSEETRAKHRAREARLRSITSI